jgi:hypothetical protein
MYSEDEVKKRDRAAKRAAKKKAKPRPTRKQTNERNGTAAGHK